MIIGSKFIKILCILSFPTITLNVKKSLHMTHNNQLFTSFCQENVVKLLQKMSLLPQIFQNLC